MTDLNKIALLDTFTTGQTHVTLLDLLTTVEDELDAHALSFNILQDTASTAALARWLDSSVAQVECLIVDLLLLVASLASLGLAVERGRRDGDAIAIAGVVLLTDVAVSPSLCFGKVVA